MKKKISVASAKISLQPFCYSVDWIDNIYLICCNKGRAPICDIGLQLYGDHSVNYQKKQIPNLAEKMHIDFSADSI